MDENLDSVTSITFNLHDALAHHSLIHNVAILRQNGMRIGHLRWPREGVWPGRRRDEMNHQLSR